MPFAYVAHLRTFILLWLMQLAPFFCTYCGWATLFAMAPVTFLFLGLDSISGEIENPFGYDWNDLPLDGIIAQLMSDLTQVQCWPTLACILSTCASEQCVCAYNREEWHMSMVC